MPPEQDPWLAETEPAGLRGGDLLSLLPLVAIAALVMLVAALVFVVRRDEAEAARTQLATDALWVEQTLRFQMSVDEDLLARMSLDAASGAAATLLENRARQHIANNPEILSVAWFDAQGRMVARVPTDTADPTTGPNAGPNVDPSSDAALAGLFAMVNGRSVRPVYGQLAWSGEVPLASFAVPLEGGGMIAAQLSLPLLLERHIPWWIAERYSVEMLDLSGQVVASRAAMETDPAVARHHILFDPPLPGVSLRITPHPRPASAGGNRLLLAAIAGLALLAIAALAALARSARRRRRIEMRLRGEMAFRRSMEESLTVGLRAKDQDGRILYVNTAFCQLVGLAPDDLIGMAMPMPYWSPERLDETWARQAQLRAGGARSQMFETRFRHADGHEIDVQVYEAPLIDARGAHRGWMGSIIDVTEARRAQRLAREQEESLARTGRLVTLGEMASTLAHELNQPLAAIASYAAGALNLLAAGRGDPALLQPALEKLALQASRAGQIIRGIQDLVRKREPRFELLRLPDVITDTLAFLAADARERRVTLQPAFAPVPAVMADRILIEQVLVNLIRNGMEAMAPDRRCGDSLSVTLGPAPGGMVEIRVADSGGGIEPSLAGRLFEPFASSKSDGMGIGLNICRSILELHRGQLGFAPRPGGGTVFTVTLPAAGSAGAPPIGETA